jgi:hypothetical protein
LHDAARTLPAGELVQRRSGGIPSLVRGVLTAGGGSAMMTPSSLDTLVLLFGNLGVAACVFCLIVRQRGL